MMNRYHEEDKAMSKDIAKEFGEGWLPPDPKISIVRPLAFPGDLVAFNNHRTPSEPQTTGTVIHLKTHWSSETGYGHVYKVRPAAKNYAIWVTDLKNLEKPAVKPVKPVKSSTSDILSELTNIKKVGESRHPEFAVGAKVKYLGASEDQIKWGSNDDPRPLLKVGQTYEISYVEIHSWHTKISLTDFPDLKFNTASFRVQR